ncbi:MAG: hypothetical protein ACKVQA_15800 [Burkholderiales bacterium]
MKQNHSDPVIDEIREIRHGISARFDHDPERLVAYYIELQKRYREQLVGTAATAVQADQSAA